MNEPLTTALGPSSTARTDVVTRTIAIGEAAGVPSALARRGVEVCVRWLKKALGMTGRKAAEDLCTKGYVAHREKRLDAAQKLYEDAFDADETLTVAAFNAGQTALERYNRDVDNLDDAARWQRLQHARGWLERTLEVDPRHGKAWRALARVDERLGRFDAAQAAWTRAEACLVPEDGGEIVDSEIDRNLEAERAEARREQARLKPAADLQRALVHARELQRDGATAPTPAHGSAVTADDAADAAADDGAPRDDAEEVADEAPQSDEERLAQARVAAAEVLIRVAERYGEDPLPGVEDLDDGIFTLAGLLLRKAGLLEEAASHFRRAVEEDRKDLEAWKNLATVVQASGDMKGALQAATSAFKLAPSDAGLVCNVGVCHLALGDLEEAAEFIAIAKGLAPKDPIIAKASAALAAAQRASAG